MIHSHLKIAWRNLFRNRAFSFINIAGLSVGMTCTMLILLWVYQEKNWNRSQLHYNEVYHVMANRNFNGQVTTGPDMMYPLAANAKEKFPEVEKAVVVSFGETTLFTNGEKRINKKTLNVGADFFDVFSFDFLEGNASVLKDPDALVITESTAKALFGNAEVMNKPLSINNGRTAYVKAIVKDIPGNSTLQFDGLIPINPSSPVIQKASQEWVNCNERIFLRIKKEVNITAMEQKLLALIQANAINNNPTNRGSIILHPMRKWRLYEEFKDGKNTGGRIQYVSLFSWIALIILLIACVNFMNLSTARSEKRAKEVGIRKTLGSNRQQLLWQFIAESVLLAFISLLFAMAFVYLTLPSFSALLNETLIIPYREPLLWITITSIVIFTGCFAGSYPALYLSGLTAIKILKGNFLPGSQALLPRKILVTCQFIVSIILISATLIIYRQLQHVKNRDLGYKTSNLVSVNATKETDRNYVALKNDLLQTGLVVSVARSSSPTTDIYGFTSGIRWTGVPEQNNLVIGFLFADVDYAKTLQARMISGREFRQGDSNAVIFNKEAIKLMGLKEPLGTLISWAGQSHNIVGVIDNMVMGSPYETAAPLMIRYENKRSSYLTIRIAEKADIRKAMAAIERIYKRYSSAYPFEYRFTDDEFNLKFNTEKLIGKLSIAFSGLTIFICCLGLFGLVSFSIERRTKEIGIRKVLGASVRQLLLLISKEFFYLVGIAFLVAIPAVWLSMHEWLKNFDYRVGIGWEVFVLVGSGILAITLITVSLNASRAALTNPVKSLRTE